ncbi:hypothetical protein KCU95_g3407, partial [Aureobasidium melanogenum]
MNSAVPHSPAIERSLEEVRMSAMLAESGDSTTHIISPAIVDDNEELDSYLSSNPAVGLRRITRTSSTGTNMGPPSRRVLFSTVLRKPLGINANQSIAAGKLEIIEKLLEPHVTDMIDLFFENVNVCFPILDEVSFRRTYTEHKDRLSCALLANLYANAMTYWKNSPRLRSCHPPDQRYIWVQANEALHSELFLSPGISTVISIVLNVHGRPSTSMFGNGGMVGTAVALSNSLGLNRDCSTWNISPEEKAFRFRIWSIVVLMDRCGFWMPMNGFTLTSATLFLLRDALKATNRTRNTSLKLAKDMIACLQKHRNNEAWDLADDCLTNCTDMTDRIEAGRNSEPSGAAETQYLVDNDSLLLNDAVLGFASAFDFDLQNFQWNDNA